MCLDGDLCRLFCLLVGGVGGSSASVVCCVRSFLPCNLLRVLLTLREIGWRVCWERKRGDVERTGDLDFVLLFGRV